MSARLAAVLDSSLPLDVLPAGQPAVDADEAQVLRYDHGAQRALCKRIAVSDCDDEIVALRWRLVLAHRGDIRGIARFHLRRAQPPITMDQLYQEGVLLAWHATRTYNPSRRPFSAYMFVTVRNGLCAIIRAEDRHRRHVVLPTAEPLDEDAPTTFNRVAPSTMEVDLSDRRQLQALWNAAELSDIQRHILIHRYGLLDQIPLSQSALGATLGVHKSWVCRREGEALDKLREVAGVDLSALAQG